MFWAGETLNNFPVKAGGAIMSPPLLLQMKGGMGSVTPIRHVVVPAHDGYLYIIDGNTGCSFKVRGRREWLLRVRGAGGEWVGLLLSVYLCHECEHAVCV